jgi:nonribosomal peptide synthetase DhbF
MSEIPFSAGELSSRVSILCGDFTLPCFGVSQEDYRRLCDRVTAVYHCAAEVNNVKPLEELISVNVEGAFNFPLFFLGLNPLGLRNILVFCRSGKTLHYISTLSVFVSSNLEGGHMLESELDSSVHTVYGGYAQSKWVPLLFNNFCQFFY